MKLTIQPHLLPRLRTLGPALPLSTSKSYTWTIMSALVETLSLTHPAIRAVSNTCENHNMQLYWRSDPHFVQFIPHCPHLMTPRPTDSWTCLFGGRNALCHQSFLSSYEIWWAQWHWSAIFSEMLPFSPANNSAIAPCLSLWDNQTQETLLRIFSLNR